MGALQGGASIGARFWAVLCALLVAVIVFAFPTSAFASSGSGSQASNLDLRKSAQAAAVYMDNLFYADKVDKGPNGLKFANAGGMLGFVDSADVENSLDGKYSTGFLSAADTLSFSSISYTSLEQSDKEMAKSLDAYARYGWALHAVGMDQTTTADGGPLRKIGAAALYGSYELANAADSVFEWSMRILARLNPFGFFVGETYSEFTNTSGTLRVDKDGHIADMNQGLNAAADGAGQLITETNAGDEENNLVKMFSTVYEMTRSIGVHVMVPIFLALLVWLAVIGKAIFGAKLLNLTRLRNFLVRLTFIILGIPLLGITYTAALNSMVDTIDMPTSANERSVDYVIVETLVDFQSWAENGRLAWRGDGPLVVENYKENAHVKAESLGNLRKNVLAINTAYGSNISGNMKGVQYGADGVSIQYDFGFASKDAAESTASGSGTDLQDAARNLLARYLAGEYYTPAQYQSHAKQSLSGNNLTALPVWLVATQNPGNYAKNYASTDKMLNKNGWSGPDAGVFTGSNIKNNNNGNMGKDNSLAEELEEVMKSRDNMDAAEFYDKVNQVYTAWSTPGAPGRASQQLDLTVPWFHDGLATATVTNDSITYDASSGLGLSTMATYNYLCTNFTDTGLAVYNPSAPNEYSSSFHYSVNAYGGGLYGALVMLNSVVLMLTLGLLGFVYGIGLLLSNLKRGFNLLISTPFAMLGMLQSIARVILLGLSMLAEVFAIGALYFIMRGLLLTMNDWFMGLASGIFGAMGIATSGTMSIAGVIASIALGTVSLLAMLMLMFKSRKAVVGGLTEMISGFVSKFVGVSGGDPGSGNMAGMLGKGALAGAAVAKMGGGSAINTVGGAALGLGVADAMSGGGGTGGDAFADSMVNADKSSADLTGGERVVDDKLDGGSDVVNSQAGNGFYAGNESKFDEQLSGEGAAGGAASADAQASSTGGEGLQGEGGMGQGGMAEGGLAAGGLGASATAAASGAGGAGAAGYGADGYSSASGGNAMYENDGMAVAAAGDGGMASAKGEASDASADASSSQAAVDGGGYGFFTGRPGASVAGEGAAGQSMAHASAENGAMSREDQAALAAGQMPPSAIASANTAGVAAREAALAAGATPAAAESAAQQAREAALYNAALENNLGSQAYEAALASDSSSLSSAVSGAQADGQSSAYAASEDAETGYGWDADRDVAPAAVSEASAAEVQADGAQVAVSADAFAAEQGGAGLGDSVANVNSMDGASRQMDGGHMRVSADVNGDAGVDGVAGAGGAAGGAGAGGESGGAGAGGAAGGAGGSGQGGLAGASLGASVDHANDNVSVNGTGTMSGGTVEGGERTASMRGMVQAMPGQQSMAPSTAGGPQGARGADSATGGTVDSGDARRNGALGAGYAAGYAAAHSPGGHYAAARSSMAQSGGMTWGSGHAASGGMSAAHRPGASWGSVGGGVLEKSSASSGGTYGSGSAPLNSSVDRTESGVPSSMRSLEPDAPLGGN